MLVIYALCISIFLLQSVHAAHETPSGKSRKRYTFNKINPLKHNHVVWCKVPSYPHASTNYLLWHINNSVHCSDPAILTSPRTDPYEVFERRLCSVQLKHSMLIPAPKDVLLPATGPRFNRPTLISYSLLLWSIKHLRPVVWRDQALWLEFGRILCVIH
jgi:hypothetical protein